MSAHVTRRRPASRLTPPVGESTQEPTQAAPTRRTVEEEIAELDEAVDDTDVCDVEAKLTDQMSAALEALVEGRMKGSLEIECGLCCALAMRRLRDAFLRAARGAPLPEGIEALLFGGGA